jgi:hypothetical protein
MDKVLSARVDEAVLARLNAEARRTGLSKKHILEEAITNYVRQAETRGGTSILRETSGAWNRREKPESTVEEARKAFRDSMNRLHA